jgi:hypothetical protein
MIAYILRMHRQAQMIRSTSLNPRDDHVLTEDVQASQNGQVNFTEQRMITYELRMHRHAQMVRSTPPNHQG